MGIFPKRWGDPRVRRRLRHPSENTYLVSCVVFSLLTVVGALSRLLSGDPNEPLILLSIPALVFFVRGHHYARQRVNGVRVTEKQFPEAHRMVREAAERFKMSRIPEAYVVLGNGVINAFASGHGFRRYVAINSDLFEIGRASVGKECRSRWSPYH